jgi:hypothetical protein
LAPDPWNDNETVDAVSRVFAAAGLGVLPSIGAADVVTIYREIGTALRAFHRTTFDSFGHVSAGVIEPTTPIS